MNFAFYRVVKVFVCLDDVWVIQTNHHFSFFDLGLFALFIILSTYFDGVSLLILFALAEKDTS